jgi:hypothetical protein
MLEEVLLPNQLPKHPPLHRLFRITRMVKQIPTLVLLATLLFSLLLIARLQRVQWVSLTVVQKMQLAFLLVATCFKECMQRCISMDMPRARRMQTEDRFVQKHAMVTIARLYLRPNHLVSHMLRLLQMATSPQRLNVAAFMISTLKEVRSGGRQCMQQLDKRWN